MTKVSQSEWRSDTAVCVIAGGGAVRREPMQKGRNPSCLRCFVVLFGFGRNIPAVSEENYKVEGERVREVCAGRAIHVPVVGSAGCAGVWMLDLERGRDALPCYAAALARQAGSVLHECVVIVD